MKVKHNLVIILVNYNGFADTKACLKSIAKTIGELPFVIIVDNASNEKNELNDLASVYPKLKLIFNKENLGFGRANNIGIQWGQENIDFDYVLLLNNDTLVESTTFHYLIEAFKIDVKIGITTGKIMYETNKDIVWYGGGYVDFKKGFPKIGDLNRKASLNNANKSGFVSFVSGCVMMFTKESISALKGFNDDFFMYCEDLELCLRTNRLGYKMYYEHKGVIYHKVQGSTKSSNDEPTGIRPLNANAMFLYYHIRSNQFYVMRKYLNGNKFRIFVFYYCMMLLKTNLRMLLYKKTIVIPTTWKILKNIMKNKPAYK